MIEVIEIFGHFSQVFNVVGIYFVLMKEYGNVVAYLAGSPRMRVI
jgi:hypothetical protein